MLTDQLLNICVKSRHQRPTIQFKVGQPRRPRQSGPPITTQHSRFLPENVQAYVAEASQSYTRVLRYLSRTCQKAFGLRHKNANIKDFL